MAQVARCARRRHQRCRVDDTRVVFFFFFFLVFFFFLFCFSLVFSFCRGGGAEDRSLLCLPCCPCRHARPTPSEHEAAKGGMIGLAAPRFAGGGKYRPPRACDIPWSTESATTPRPQNRTVEKPHIVHDHFQTPSFANDERCSPSPRTAKSSSLTQSRMEGERCTGASRCTIVLSWRAFVDGPQPHVGAE